VPDHAGLGEGETEEHAHRVQRDETMRVTVEDDQQAGGDGPEQDDAVGEDETVAEIAQLAGQVPVASLDACEAGEAVEARVGGQHQDHRCEQLDGVVHGPVAESRSGYLRDDRLVVQGDHAQHMREAGDPKEQAAQQQCQPGEHLRRVFRHRFTECLHAVGHGLDPGECRTTR